MNNAGKNCAKPSAHRKGFFERLREAPAEAAVSPRTVVLTAETLYPIQQMGFLGQFQVISQKARYALRALIALAGADNMMIADIATQQRIPRKFLEQILLDLKRHGIVASRRPAGGAGYGLLTPPDQITFGRVLRIIDGPIAPLPC